MIQSHSANRHLSGLLLGYFPGFSTLPGVPICLSVCWLRLAGWVGLAGVLLWPLGVRADHPQWAYQTFPFEQTLNMNAVYEVAHSAPEHLIETIGRWGVDILLVRSTEPAGPMNRLLAGLPLAAPDLLSRVEFLDSYEGLVVHADSPTRAMLRPTILIRDTAPSYTLIHEFVQSQLRPLRADEPDDALQVRFGAAFKRLLFYQKRLYDDPYKLLQPLWRRDILAAQTDVAQDLFGRIRIGQSQEVIVEKLLSSYIDERSPFFTATRREQGLVYGAFMMDNAIDMYNTLNMSVTFVEIAVGQLGRALREGDILPGKGATLTENDEASLYRTASDIKARLALVGAELEVLLQFYSR